MAPPKRKRLETRSKANARPKYVDPTDSTDSATPPREELFEAVCILGERRVRGSLQYLIKWKGIDPATGEDYLPTWEPKEHPNESLLASWKQDRASGRNARASTAPGADASDKRPKQQKQAQQQQPRPRRKLRIVESSPEPTTAHPSTTPSRASTHTPEGDSPRPRLDPSNTVAFTGRAHREVQVQIRQPGDFDPDAYERYSQLAASTSHYWRSETQATDLDSSQLFAVAPLDHSSGVVQDSQSSEGEGSFVPATQQTTGTTQQSSTAHGTQKEATEDSSLLDILLEVDLQPPSPAISIPETLYDNTADPQSQLRREGPRQDSEVPETLETPGEHLLFNSEHGQNDDDSRCQQQPYTVTREEDHQLEDLASQAHLASSTPCCTSPRLIQVSLSQGVARSEHPYHDEDQQNPIPTVDSLVGISQHGVPALARGIQSGPDAQSVTTITKDLIARDKLQNPQGISEVYLGQHNSGGWACGTLRSFDLQQAGSQDKEQASLTERSERDEAAQLPFSLQHPLHLSQLPIQPTTSQAVRDRSKTSDVEDNTLTHIGPIEQAEQRETVPKGTSANSATQSSSYNRAQQPRTTDFSLIISTQAEDDELLSEFLEPDYIRSSRSPTIEQPVEAADDTIVQSTYQSHRVEVKLRRQDFTCESQPTRPTDQSTAFGEENAQVVPPNHDFCTQEDTVGDIQPSVEKEDVRALSSPASRHDSSQDTPVRQSNSAGHSSSPIPPPPSHSLGSLASPVPFRPETPIITSSQSIMVSQDTGKVVEQRMKELLAEKQAQNPFTPTRRMRDSALTPSTAEAMPSAIPATSRRLLRTGASPPAAEGTRSPSTVPDRSPAPQAPASLRTVALTHASQPVSEDTHEETAKARSIGPPLEDVEEKAPKVPVIVTTEPTVFEVSSDDMELSDGEAEDDDNDDDDDDDGDDDTTSLLNDDLQLAVAEYVIPLFIEGRQSDMYSAYIKQKNEVLDRFLKDSGGVQPLEQVEEVLSYLKAIETHIDLVFAEAGSASDNAMNSATQVEFAAQFGMENSTKFRFLHWLFHTLRNHEKHVVLVVENDNDALFTVIRTFCRANFIHYSMPTRGLEADAAETEGSLLVSIFSGNTSPNIRPVDVIVCLDGVQNASQIRQKTWATNPEVEFVPLLHLVIPRSIGHIERYLSSTLDRRKRTHTILASLAQMRGELGKPIDEDTPKAPRAACIVADWLITAQEDRGLLPLTSIGSVKDVIEFQTQPSPRSTASPLPVPERAKRPHDDEELDPVKRMRFTPQPQVISSSSVKAKESTQISDSMPGTAMEDASKLRAQLARLEEAYQNECAAREAERARFMEQELMWERQQTVHEDQVKQYRLLLGQQQSTEQRLETTTKNNDMLRERLATRTTELQIVNSQLHEQRTTHLLSDDAKLVEITKLRNDLAAANEKRTHAIKAKESADKMLEYTKEEYRKASDAAGTSSATIANLEAQNAHLAHAASGQPAVLKKLHFDRQYENLAMQVRNLKAENMTLKKTLNQKEEELQRAKLSGERQGVRTRGTSATPQPGKVRSRAASPLGGRLSNLRNG